MNNGAWVLIGLVVLAMGLFYVWPKHKNQIPFQAPVSQSQENLPALYYPIQNFTSGITKKYFGTYVTPQNSPVKPERFIGYHTGVDVEAGDMSGDVSVYAIASGRVLQSRIAGGYGGLAVVEYYLAGRRIVGIYGHLKSASLVPAGTQVSAGQKIGILGQGYTKETDGERKHLHFALYIGGGADIRGYVQNSKELANWLDPVQFFKEYKMVQPE